MSTKQERKHADLPMQTRFVPVNSVDAQTRTAEMVFSVGAQVKRRDWWTGDAYLEELSMDPAHVHMERMNNGAPLLNTHNRYDLFGIIGVVESARIENGQGLAKVRFSDREDVAPIFRDVQNGIIRNVSVGYVVNRYEKTDPPAGSNALPVWRAIDWTPCEVSLVPIGADAGAGIRSAEGKPAAGVPTFPCEFTTPADAAAVSSTPRKENTMTTERSGQDDAAAAAQTAQTEADKTRVANLTAEAAKTERERITNIRARVQSLKLGDEFGDKLINDGTSFTEACRQMVDKLAEKQPAAAVVATRVEVAEDERIKLREAVSAALIHRVNPKGKLPDNGAGDFRYHSLMRVAEEVINREGVKTRGMPPMEIASRALMSTSDFPNILLDAINKRLRLAYEENKPSYTRWARRAPNAPDFKNINVIQLSGAPDLLKILEGGEYKTGSLSDGKETYNVFTYGRKIGISRQALINDDLNALDRVPGALSGAARRLENRTVYGVLTGNAAMADAGLLFNLNATSTAGGHANYSTGTGSALSLASLTSSRAAMRIQKGYQAEELNLAPAYLIVPAALEQTAYQLTSTIYVPTKPADINEFRAGGRTALEPIVEAVLDATSTTGWYLAADYNQVDTVEYCYLEGFEGLYIENRIGFDIDGIELKGRLDFAAAPIDWRGLYNDKGS